VLCDLAGDDAGILDALDRAPPAALDRSWNAWLAWLRAAALDGLGDPAASLHALSSVADVADRALKLTLANAERAERWALGQVDEVLVGLEALVDGVEATGVAHNLVGGAADASRAMSHVGRVDDAVTFLRRAEDACAGLTGTPLVRLALAAASLRVAEGDERTATAILRDALAGSPIETGSSRRAWREALALTYVLVPETRPRWEAASLRGHWVAVRNLARSVVRGRNEASAASPTVQLDDLGAVQAALPYRFAAELAAQTHRAGRSHGQSLLDALGSAGRDALRDLVNRRDHPLADAAAALLRDVPAPPLLPVGVAVLGPVEVRHDGRATAAPELSRERVRALLTFLSIRPASRREAIIGALWPDLDERAGANNLRVTVNHLQRALEPWRRTGEPAYLLRSAGPTLQLLTGLVDLDIEQFERHVRAARDAEAGACPSVALDHYLAAADLYRGEFAANITAAEWVDLPREHYRGQFVTAGCRGAELLVARGDIERGEELARQMLDAEPWSEQAYGVLAAAALDRGDRTSAHRWLARCAEALDDLGVEASERTRQLQRRLRGTGVDSSGLVTRSRVR
jgi:DNA-binding SARP family transcriptional activator